MIPLVVIDKFLVWRFLVATQMHAKITSSATNYSYIIQKFRHGTRVTKPL